MVEIHVGSNVLKGILDIPKGATGIVLFAHGSGSGRLSPRNQFVAKKLANAGIATLLMDLLTDEEESIDERTRQFRFDIDLLADRLIGCVDWLTSHNETKNLKIGYFGASTGAAAALFAAAEQQDLIFAIVSRGGRPDLAIDAMDKIKAPTLFIVGGDDFGVIELNERAFEALNVEKKLEIVPGATHLFEEPGKLEIVADLATAWFTSHLNEPLRH